jgi:CPA1 family monovalent cation:H+ antiporter
MPGFFATLISLSALFGYVNHKWLKLPVTIGVMLISVFLGLVLKIIGLIDYNSILPLHNFLKRFDFSSFLLDFILCFLLFSGSLHVKWSQLKDTWITILSYSTIGVVISTLIIGLLSKSVLDLAGFHLNLLPCFLFGALISPTDPVAVIGILSKYKIPEKLKTEIIGESLFNDGIGVVVFSVIYSIITSGTTGFSTSKIGELFIMEVVGGVGIGLITGYVGFLLMKSIDHYQTEVMITLAVVTGGYTLASVIHASGPLAMVIAGLLIGNHGKAFAMSDLTAEYVDKFWELIDEICNMLLFVLMGLEIFIVPFNLTYLAIAVALILVALFARYISLAPVFFIANRKEPYKMLNLSILTWGGLRGGISIALALSLSNKTEGSSLFIFCTYCIVLFSIIVQGLSIKKLLSKF